MIDPVVEDEGWRAALPDLEALAASCAAAGAAHEPALGREIAILFCSDAAIAALNSRFRSKDGATNVLSFPSGAPSGFLGDMALARETCVREAAEKGLPLRNHAAHLMIHGMLHLIGYDHMTDEDAAMMERREADILAALGVPDPYAGE